AGGGGGRAAEGGGGEGGGAGGGSWAWLAASHSARAAGWRKGLPAMSHRRDARKTRSTAPKSIPGLFRTWVQLHSINSPRISSWKVAGAAVEATSSSRVATASW